MKAIDSIGLRKWWNYNAGAELDPRLTNLRQVQYDILEWAESEKAPYLLVNAPTGIGKTLTGGIFAADNSSAWTYVVSTKALQDQVARDLGIPTLKGRDNFACLIGQSTHGFAISAARGKCVFGHNCTHDGGPSVLPEDRCDYYGQKHEAFSSKGRVTNYAMALAMPELRLNTKLLVADEAHRIEGQTISHSTILLDRVYALRHRLKVPYLGKDPVAWAQWARNQNPVKANNSYDYSAKILNEALASLKKMDSAPNLWRVDDRKTGVRFSPIFASQLVLPNLFGHRLHSTSNQILMGDTGRKPITRVMMMSATLLAPDLMERTLGLPSGSYAYLDLPSPFPKTNRPIYFAPVKGMNRVEMETANGRKPMQDAMDNLIERYLLSGKKCGIIHAVSRKYRDAIVSETRWKAFTTTDPLVHGDRSTQGKPSILVSDSIFDGWDGHDDLCRFVLMPKVPFPNLADAHVAARQNLDPRSYDYDAIINIIQGAGRGVRHETDYADTWILDSNWDGLMKRRKDWIPKSFMEAYHHGVSI